MHPTKLPDGPPAHLLTGHATDLHHDRLGCFTRWARDYGDFVPLRLGPRRGFLLSHPDYLREVLVSQQHNFIRPYPVRQSRTTFGDSMFITSGPRWLRQRHLAQPAFDHRHVNAYAQAMVDCTERMLARWRDGERRDIHQEMMALTLAVVGRTLFDADVEGDAQAVGQAMTVVLERFTARMDSALPLPERLPTPGILRLRHAVRQIDTVIYRMIREVRDGDEDDRHLLALLLRARDEDGNTMTDTDVRDEAMAFFLAGHETTALALTWTFYLLSQHPQAQAALDEELRAVLDGRPPTAADLPRLPYTGMVLRESMRLYPPAYAFARDSLADCEIGGWLVPGGSTVIMSQWVLHHDPRYWKQPERFDPDRWVGDLAARLPRFVYFPFGGGPHLCIGSGFATLEATLLLATIAQRFRLALVPDHPVVLQPLMTLRPRHGVRMSLHERVRGHPVTALRAE
jgi:cytochrome P450